VLQADALINSSFSVPQRIFQHALAFRDPGAIEFLHFPVYANGPVEDLTCFWAVLSAEAAGAIPLI
jgi:hypothetical protein